MVHSHNSSIKLSAGHQLPVMSTKNSKHTMTTH